MGDAQPGMDHLTKALRAAASGTGAFVTVRGPMGAGKTALLRALAGQADSAGAVVLRASGTPAERDWEFGVADQLRPVPVGFAVIVVDDLQWADEPSVRWLVDVAASALVVTAVRDGEPGAEIALPGSVVRVERESAGWSQRRVVDCLRRQPEPVWGVAKAMAVLGDHADPGLITDLAGLDDVTFGTAVRSLRALGFVTSSRDPRFVDPAVRNAVLATMTTSEFDTNHAAAAALLFDRGQPAEDVAEHLVATGAALPEWATDVLRTAALRQGQRPIALDLLRRAVSEPGPDRAALLVDLAVAESATDGLPALQHLCHAIQAYESGRDRVAAVLRMPIAALGAVPPLARDVIGEVEQDVRRLGDRDLSLRIEARLRYAGHTDLGELTDSTTRLGEFGPEPGTAGAAERELLTVLSFSAALVSRTPAEDVAALADRLLDHVPPGAGRVDEMTRLLVKTLCAADSPRNADRALATGPGTADDQASLLASRALVAAHRGEVADAVLLAHNVLERGPGDVGQDVLLTLALVALKVQDERWSERLLARLPARVDNVCTAAVLDVVRGADAAARGDARGGLRRLTDAGRRLDRSGWRNVVLFPWRTTAVRLHQRLGDTGAARSLAEDDHDRAVEWGAPAGVGRTLRVLGGLTGGTEGTDLVRAAVDALSSSADRLELARAHLALGLRLRDQDEQAAAEHLRRCHDIAVERGDRRLARQAGTHLRGEVRRAELTRTERRVVALAVAGRSNQEMANALSVSVRAIEKHLTNSYRKLGVLGRAELAGALNHPF
ncbi:LuxR C-terminal-related transcriptional regulator [Umezawaea endophytica]|uniref:LuxR C-terminal-related transcriptional regulator n=1 Tax=Umezawaea endophytica TaxID=1654476 RepID=A0A9X2VI57_9PSEU|nr:LuxR family transcriptional regulator [Umezawaea endophytica]MCS7477011.1 LuxR C-terminal-related transcriptional regulator [Umezawaea endophytica]